MVGLCGYSKFITRRVRIGKTPTQIPTFYDIRKIQFFFGTTTIGKIELCKHNYNISQSKTVILKQLSKYKENKYMKFEKQIKEDGDVKIETIKLLVKNGTVSLTDHDIKSMFMINRINDPSYLYIASSQLATVEMRGNDNKY